MRAIFANSFFFFFYLGGQRKSVFNLILQDQSGSVSVAIWNCDQHYQNLTIGESIELSKVRVAPKSHEYQRGGSVDVELVLK